MPEHEINEVKAVTIAVGDSEVTFPGVESSWFGQLAAPKSLAELLHFLAQLTETEMHIAGWRGQSNIAWAIHSSAVRRILVHGPPPANVVPTEPGGIVGAGEIDKNSPLALEYYLGKYESYLLNEARLAGHGFHEGRKLTDLELLAALQHHGAATRLLDFSRNAAVALWFAASAHPEEFGLLAAVKADKITHLISEADTARSIRDTVFNPLTFSWQPQHLFERMRVQQSFFLFSRAEMSKWGSLALLGPTEENSGLILLAISPELKSEVARVHHQRLFGFTGVSLFPDLEGFSRFQSAGAPYLILR